jgi:hypothetical protein
MKAVKKKGAIAKSGNFKAAATMILAGQTRDDAVRFKFNMTTRKLLARPMSWVCIMVAVVLLAGCASSTIDTRGDSEYCEIHHSYMNTVKFPGQPEGPPPSMEYFQARMKYFRHSYPASLQHRPHTDYIIYLCDYCVQAEAEWKHAHGYVP